MFAFSTGRKSVLSISAFVAVSFLLAPLAARADYVGSLTNRIFIDPPTLSAVADGFDNGDEFAYILETTPRDTGSDVGMAAWATVYIPPGVEVIGASFVQPAGGGLFTTKNAETADLSYSGCGKRGCKAYVPTTGTT